MIEENMEPLPKATKERKRSLIAGTKLSQPDFGEDVIISGMAGRFPNSDDIYAFRDNLYNKVDLVSGDNRRWEPTHPEIPQRTGKINLINKFDAGFFGVHERQAHTMDPMCRMLLEKSFEAIMDAGVNPAELAGTNTGVFVGCCFSETEKSSFYDKLGHQNYGITGCTRSMLAKRISYFFKFEGPSFISDTACSSSLFALEHAYKAIRDGKCDQAIVGGSNLCLHPVVSLQFARLGVLSIDGACKSFDNSANGYARSEAVCAIFLQKSKDVRRIYAQIIHSKTNCDGFKEQGITYPSGKIQRILLDEFYEECNIDPSSLSYVEAHGTGTKVGDPEELGTLHGVFCENRTEPLLIGSVKSNIGHNEPVSGLCSVVKVLLGMEAGFIPPNMHYDTPRAGVTALETGAMKVVSEKTKWPHSVALAGINSFGFGGANSHLLVRWNEKEKDVIKRGLRSGEGIDRLVCVSGRTEEAVERLINSVMEEGIDVEYVRLLHQIFGTEVENNYYRGYCVLSSSGSSNIKSIQHFNGKTNPLHFIFSGLDRAWPKIGKDLFSYPLFTATIQEIHTIMDQKMDVNIVDVIVNYNSENIVHQFVGTIAIQIALGEILRTCHIEPDRILGCSLGELSAAYFDDVLTLEKTILIAYYTAKVLQDDIAGKQLLKSIKKILPKPVKLGLKWTPSMQNFVSDNTITAEYFSQGLLNQLVLAKTKVSIPKDVVLLEIGSLNMETSTFNGGSLNVVSLIPKIKQNVNGMFESIGRLYEFGFNPKLEKLYPEVSFPVSRGTRMISPFIRWDHEKNWFITVYNSQDKIKSGYRVIDVSIRDDDWSFIGGHVIDGRYLFPATGYLSFVWETLAMMLGKITSEMYVIFENVKFIRAATVPLKTSLELIISIQKGSGLFEVAEGGTAIVTGRVYEGSYTEDDWATLSIPVPTSNDQSLLLKESDIYKELKLRGYNYNGQFRALKECDTSATCGRIEWTGNWITFMDNMLQIQILKEDTRNLYVPTSIQQLSVNAKKHLTCVKNNGEDPLIPVYAYDDIHIIRSGGIEIRGLNASSIVRRKQAEPVLETYKFVGNTEQLSLEQSVCVNIQLALENDSTNIIRPKVVEILTPSDESTLETATTANVVNKEEEPLMLTVQSVFDDLPVIQAELFILSNKQGLEYGGITVEDRKISSERDCFIVAGNNLLQQSEVFIQVLQSLKPNGFIMTRESIHTELGEIKNNLQVISDHTTGNERVIFLQKCKEKKSSQTVIEITQNDDSFTWLNTLQKTLKSTDPNTSTVILFAQNCTNSGILGLVNCLRREPNTAERIRCVFVADKSAPAFDAKLPFYAEQLARGLAMNVYCYGKWGTYRHLRLKESLRARSEHCYVNVTVRGDLSSLKWIEGSLSSSIELDTEKTLVYIYSSTINFRDVMTASGKISADVITKNRIEQDCVQGFEFSGRDKNGRRVMGMVTTGALATMVCADSHLLWTIPDAWTMEEAATVPVVYGTVLYAFFTRANLRPGQSVLIHSGTGGVGQAAINIALHYGCTVFTTVGTDEKRAFIRRNYPQIRAAHIGNSRDTSFEQMVLRETRGRGVDLVLNSLAEEKLQASVRCVAAGGSFIEIGKFDLASDNALQLELFARGATFHGVMLDALFVCEPVVKERVTALLVAGIKNGSVRPLPRTSFKMAEVEQAFRYMATGKHMGKVLVRIRKEETFRATIPKAQYFDAVPRYFCNPRKVYIILGGLGGFGLELADWLVLRGAKNLVLTTRTGVKSGYQSMRLRTWKSYGVTVKIAQNDASTVENCIQLITDGRKLGEVAAVFNLAVVLKDALFDNQTIEDYQTSFSPKATTTTILDRVTRDLCPTLEQFVVFSSVSCGRGNAGQSNYGMANSIMERICEQRHREGLPAVAIQWGAIGDVGLVAEHMAEDHGELVIGGTLQQRVSSCLEVLDRFLRQREPVVASMVVAEKKTAAGGAGNMVDAVVNILGLRDLKTVSLHSTLPELGMDSMMAVEIKQTLEREYEMFLTPQDIRGMTFARLQELSVEKTEASNNTEKAPHAVQLLFKFIANEEWSNIPMVRMNTALTGGKTPKVFLLPGVEGTSLVFDHLAHTLKAELICFQFCNDVRETTIDAMAAKILPQIMEILKNDHTFNIVAYSFGSLVALELVASLEKNGYSGNLILIDGGIELMRELVKTQLQTESEEMFQTTLLCVLMSAFIPYETLFDIQLDLLKCSSYTDRIRLGYTKCPTDLPHSFDYIERVCISAYDRIKAITLYKPQHAKFSTSVHLYRPTNSSVQQISEDYKLGEWCLNGKVEEIKYFEGNHVSILDNDDVAKEINKVLGMDEEEEEERGVKEEKISAKEEKQEGGRFTKMISTFSS